MNQFYVNMSLAVQGHHAEFSVYSGAFQAGNEPSAFNGLNFRVTLDGARERGLLVRGVDSLGKSKLQTQIGKVIRQDFAGYKIHENSRPSWLTSPIGERLELDFYLPELSLAFEVQGQQHYRFTPRFHKSDSDFNGQLRRDSCKRDICYVRNISLFEVTSLDDYHALDKRLATIKRQARLNNFIDHILKRVAQELINCAGMQKKVSGIKNNLANARRSKSRRAHAWLLKGKVFDLEMCKRRIRYLSIIAINDFEGRHIPTGILKPKTNWRKQAPASRGVHT